MYNLYTREDVLRLVGIQTDLLGYWLQSGLIRTSNPGQGRGTPRRFTADDLIIIALIKELSHYGCAKRFLEQFTSLAYAKLVEAEADPNINAGSDDWWKVKAHRSLTNLDMLSALGIEHLIWDIAFEGEEMTITARPPMPRDPVFHGRARSCITLDLTTIARDLWKSRRDDSAA